MHRAGIFALALSSLACKRSSDTAPPQPEPEPANGGTTSDGAPAASPLASTGLGVCDSYAADFQRCIALAPADARDELREALSTATTAWNEAIANGDSERVVRGCYAAREAAEEALGPMGCTFAHVDDPPRPDDEELAETPKWRGPMPKVGVAECDAFLVDHLRCIEDKFPEGARAQVLDDLRVSVEAWAEAAKQGQREGLAAACRAANDASRKATASMGCTYTTLK